MAFVSDEMAAGRVLAHGQITDLTEGFSLASKQPFALFIIPKTGGSAEGDLTAKVDCKLYQDDVASDCPFTCNCWDSPAVLEIEPTGIDLTVYDVWFGPGANVDES